MSFMNPTHISDDNGEPNQVECDAVALNVPRGEWSDWQSNTLLDTISLILVPVTGSSSSFWIAYIMTGEDVFNYAGNPANYSGQLVPQQVAQALKDSGVDVRLKQYTNILETPTFTETDVALT